MLLKKEKMWIANLRPYTKKYPSSDIKIKRACCAWRGQKYRAIKNGYEYIKNYKKFLAWYFIEYKKRKVWVKPHVGRIDHSKGYSFNNIVLQESFENIEERNTRYSRPVLVMKDDSFVGFFESQSLASVVLNVPKGNISACVNRKSGRRTSKGYSFYNVC